MAGTAADQCGGGVACVAEYAVFDCEVAVPLNCSRRGCLVWFGRQAGWFDAPGMDMLGSSKDGKRMALFFV